MRSLLETEQRDVALAWAAVALVFAVTGWSLVTGTLGWAVFGVVLATVLLATPVAYRTAEVMPPWPVALLAAIPYAIGVAVGSGPVARLAASGAVAAVAVVVVLQIETFTRVRMNRGFAVAFVVMTTVTAAGVWELGRWLVDLAVGTDLVGTNDDLMWRLVASALGGVAAGLLVDRYLMQLPGTELVPDGFDVEDADDQVDATGDRVSAVLEAAGLATEHQRYLARGLQVVLAVILLVGVVTLNVDVVVSGGIGLAATLVPALLRRDWNVQVDIGLTLWIAVAVVIHTMGSLAFYQTVWGWHNLAHAVTGTLVAGIGYTAVRAVETHTTAVDCPPRFTFLLVVLFVFSFGVFWEILEFTLDGVAAAVGSDGVVLSQHGRGDTLSDFVANTVGALVVAGATTVSRLR